MRVDWKADNAIHKEKEYYVEKSRTKLKVVGGAKPANEPNDGRRKRSERSREKILDACFSLVIDGNMDPSAHEIAECAGVGLRSVFRHFEDIDSIHSEMIARLEETYLPRILQATTSNDWREQMLELLEIRSKVYEEIMRLHVAGSIRRYKSTVLMEDYNRMRRMELSAIKAIIPSKLSDDKPLLFALEATLSLRNWYTLRVEHKLTIPMAKKVITKTLKCLLADYRS
jgi:AcrR family transcriptional regulator